MHVIFTGNDTAQRQIVHKICGIEVAFSRDDNTGLLVWSYAADAEGRPEDSDLEPVLSFMMTHWDKEKSPGVYAEFVSDAELTKRARPDAMLNSFQRMEDTDFIKWVKENSHDVSLLRKVMDVIANKSNMARKTDVLRKAIKEAAETEKFTQPETAPTTPVTPPAAEPATAPDENSEAVLYDVYAQKLKDGATREALEKEHGAKFTKNEWKAIKDLSASLGG